MGESVGEIDGDADSLRLGGNKVVINVDGAKVGILMTFNVGLTVVGAAVVGISVVVSTDAAVVSVKVGVGVGSLVGTSREISSDVDELLADKIVDGFFVDTDEGIFVGTRAGFSVDTTTTLEGCSVPVEESEGGAVGGVLGLIVLLGYEEGT